MEKLSAQKVIELLELEALPAEGGYFRQVWQSRHRADMNHSESYNGESRSFGTAIYYLVTPEDFSAMHLVTSDELWHFYAGDTLEQLLLFPDGASQVRKLGSDLLQGEIPLSVVPENVWQGTRLVAGGAWALVGTTVCPGFEYADYHHGQLAELAQRFPAHAGLLAQLCR